MSRVPRNYDNDGHDMSWTTTNRPQNPSHGTIGYNETTQQLEVYDAVHGFWKTTQSLTEVYAGM